MEAGLPWDPCGVWGVSIPGVSRIPSGLGVSPGPDPSPPSAAAFRALLQIRAVRKKPGALSPVSFSPVLAQSLEHDEHSVSAASCLRDGRAREGRECLGQARGPDGPASSPVFSSVQ